MGRKWKSLEVFLTDFNFISTWSVKNPNLKKIEREFAERKIKKNQNSILIMSYQYHHKRLKDLKKEIVSRKKAWGQNHKGINVGQNR